MILDESLFHPTLPSHKQGLGAWKRQAGAGNVRPKRACNEDAVPEPARKLRRTASAKLGSQSERIWGEIVNGPQGEGHVEKNQLPPPKSLPVSRPTVLEPKSFVTDTTLVDDDAKTSFKVDPPNGGQQSRGRGIFSGYGFFIHAFTSQQVSRLSSSHAARDRLLMGALRSQFCESTFSVTTATSSEQWLITLRLLIRVDCLSSCPIPFHHLIYLPSGSLILQLTS